MPKSRTRKDHKKKVLNRTQNIKAQKAKQEREFMNMITKAQEEVKNRSEKVDEQIEEIGDLGDMQLD